MNFHPYDYYGHGGPDFPPNDLGFHMDEPLLGPPIPPQPSAQVPHDPLDARPGEHSWLYGHPQPIYRHAGPVLKPRRAPLPPPYAGYKDYDAYESVPINFERQQQMQRAADRPLSYRNLGNSFAVPKGSRTAMHRISAMATTARDPAHLHPAGKRLMDAAKAGGVQIGRAPVTVHVTSANGAASGRPERERERHDDAHGGGRNASVKAEQKSSQGSTRTETPPGKPNSAAAAAAPSNGPPKAPTPATQYPLSVPTTWKRTFESTRVRCPQESGVVAPVVELASQMLNSRCAQVIPVLGGGTRQKFTMVIDSTILKRGVLSSRSDDGMTLAMYLFKMGRGTNTGELVSADLMLGKMVVWVNDMRLLRSNTTTDGVQIDLLPALSPETLDRKTVKITIEADPYEFGSGFAMLCLRRLDPQLVRAADGLSAEPSLLRRHSAPGPPYPTPALGAIKRSTSTFSPSPSISVAEPPTISEKRPRQGSSENEEEDDGIEIGDQIVSLICPIVMRKIGIPGKGRGCRHVQCFDLEVGGLNLRVVWGVCFV
ncbi:uncharacterized protein EV422DRAFT_50826 [Fimicolochytrium jonesii]|uniref:uncharacterized protein n=1 Tax=Fimicolochytrium jonesii TaxID=1396493 RepID=UPI0022FF2F9F|nr:uncharacterized protein EV422DRAFT_50826 [Fimicolochytrium jonesii]KAI8821050.1 hypothetical protein EV422DRAFT_50826 [Fimicolochytrium jonesii]